MAHAETCPVCNGIGRTEYVEQDSTTVRKSQPCHGCGGKGWIEVGSDDPVVIPMTPWPVPQQPYFPIVTYTYMSNRGL